MRWIFWILGLFALAVGLAMALRFNIGYALLVLPPYRAEISLNLLILLLFLGFLGLYLVARLVLAGIALPQRVREFRERRRRDTARDTVLTGVRAYFEGRFGKAEKAAAAAMEMGETPALAAVLAAHAAHELRHYAQRDGYLARAEKLAPDDAAIRVIAKAKMLLDQRDYHDALTALKELPERHTAGLRLELKAQQQAKNWEHTLPIIEQLERRKVFDELQAEQLRRYAHVENLKRKAVDVRALQEAWQRIPAKYQRDSKIASAAAQCYSSLGGYAQASQIIEQALDATWDSELIALYGEYAGGDVVRQIERAEGWLQRNPGDAALLLALGRLCARQELWGKSQSYLEASLSIEPTYSAHLALAQLHDTLGNMDTARRHYRESLELAVGQLRQITGGRRRTPL